MNLYEVKGDLIELYKQDEFNAIGHGCNCFHTMGAGIALAINRYTNGKALKVDKESVYGDINKLGKDTYCDFGPGRIYNLYTQYSTAHDNCVAVHWKSVREAIEGMIVNELVITEFLEPVHVAIPLIGCGLANGSKKDLFKVLDYISDDFSSQVSLTVVEYSK